MSHKNTFRVAVVGHPSTEQWLLAAVFAAIRTRPCCYELVTDPADRSPDILVVDSEDEDALVRWRKRDPLGVIPAAFFVKVPPRAKCAVIVARPITSGRIVDALDQISRRFLGETTATTMGAAANDRELVPAAA
ncbi:MAG: hypothetical protein EXR33_10705 [Betaproteobacteria bacterium]|nr:hypothetical protein [Betaproteobacteria bacterium]